MKILVTGGLGFIGSNFICYHQEHYPNDYIVNIDALTYASNTDNLAGINQNNYQFYNANILDQGLLQEIIQGSKIDLIVNFAAESHVDRSIDNPEVFVKTNVEGTFSLLELAYLDQLRLIQISTDEVYGTLPPDEYALETAALSPSSPYAASKASADLLALSYHKTYGLKLNIIRSTNNYGPFQHLEKFIPKTITHCLSQKPIPVYGTGKNMRDWLYVEDNVRAIELVIHHGKDGEIYNVGANNEISNLEVVDSILKELGADRSLVNFVDDRPGHDLRYGVDVKKITALGWQQKYAFADGLKKTIEWYQTNPEWWNHGNHS
ncbi:dTDP-glucose 4,6-dehydratase [Xylocopilactobacillus apis]|uniref:dTDP-glucose 4,6-dehydratase n=1 Tax=Xylocopilactobacillus apis TaxID=2932183 RepID=A0AAU9D733_9LACO|nr:dTDP-glucose 4,6-dehydratase [Xylocopilactobacillus apis]BDR57220.1 dTDP-glucose 4,6-dehydratase [Xylocopilactobacillus apis]